MRPPRGSCNAGADVGAAVGAGVAVGATTTARVDVLALGPPSIAVQLVRTTTAASAAHCRRQVIALTVVHPRPGGKSS